MTIAALSTAMPNPTTARQRAQADRPRDAGHDNHDEYGSASEAIRRSGIGRRRLATLAASGAIRVSAIPGQSLRYHLGDACRVAREASVDCQAGTR